MENDYLQHHGIKGMKWGVRRYQNADGSLTNEGKKRYGNDDNNKARNAKIARTVAGAAIMGATVAAAAVYVKKHPEVTVKALLKISDVKIKDISEKTVKKGSVYIKKAVKQAQAGVKEGLKEAAKEAPKKATKAVATGVTLNLTKKALDTTVGKGNSDRIFQANDKDKIGKFWKVNSG